MVVKINQISTILTVIKIYKAIPQLTGEYAILKEFKARLIASGVQPPFENVVSHPIPAKHSFRFDASELPQHESMAALQGPGRADLVSEAAAKLETFVLRVAT